MICLRLDLARFLVQVANLVGHLRALANPMVDACDVQFDALFRARRNGVVITQALDVAAVTRAARVGDDDVVEGTLLGAATGKANLDHCDAFLCCPVAIAAR